MTNTERRKVRLFNATAQLAERLWPGAAHVELLQRIVDFAKTRGELEEFVNEVRLIVPLFLGREYHAFTALRNSPPPTWHRTLYAEEWVEGCLSTLAEYAGLLEVNGPLCQESLLLSFACISGGGWATAFVGVNAAAANVVRGHRLTGNASWELAEHAIFLAKADSVPSGLLWMECLAEVLNRDVKPLELLEERDSEMHDASEVACVMDDFAGMLDAGIVFRNEELLLASVGPEAAQARVQRRVVSASHEIRNWLRNR